MFEQSLNDDDFLSSSRIRSIQIIYIALGMGTTFFAGVACKVVLPLLSQVIKITPSNAHIAKLLWYALIVFMLPGYTIAGGLFRNAISALSKMSSPTDSQQIFNRLQSACVMRILIYEGLAFVGIFTWMLSATSGVLNTSPLYWLSVLPYFILMGMILGTFPNRKKLSNLINQNYVAQSDLPTSEVPVEKIQEKKPQQETVMDFVWCACSAGFSIAGGCAYAWKMASYHSRYRGDITLTGSAAEHYGLFLIVVGIAIGVIPFRNYFLHTLEIENYPRLKKAIAYFLICVFLALPGAFPTLIIKLDNKSPQREEEIHNQEIYGDYERILARDFINDVKYQPHEVIMKKVKTTIDWHRLPAFRAEINALRKKGISNLTPQEAELWLALQEQIKIIQAKRH